MAFVDELKLHIEAGSGGNGVVRWRHMKGKEFGGPSGGNGGRGGSVYAVAVRNVHLLSKYRAKKEFLADRGGDGRKNGLFGSHGEDLEIAFPVGSIITNLDTEEKISLLKDGEKFLLLKGGYGGRGNEAFKSSINRSPKQFTTGEEGEKGDFFVEIELVADIGLIGLPSAGKTSILNELTSAGGRVGAYPFTTLEPNLGEFYGFIISDIPGLIEGASGGKGLGHKFLRHVMRTKILVHLVSLEDEDPVESYKVIRKELEDYNEELTKKEEIIVLTKTDIMEDPKEIEKIAKKMKKISKDVFTLSIYDDKTIKKLRHVLLDKLKESEKEDTGDES